jgi:arabinose-5-phosphate isomerase
MNFIAYLGAQASVDNLMALHGAFRFECGGYHHRVEMHIVRALHQSPASRHTRLNHAGYFIGCHRLSHKRHSRVSSYAMQIAFTDEHLVTLGRQALEVEIAGISAQLPRLGAPFAAACRLCIACAGRVVVSGMGKSGHIAGKIAATLASTGTPAFFVHPGEASHGDVGMITRHDVFLALSNSGETDEILTLLPFIKRLGVPVVALTGNSDSTLARAANVHLDVGVPGEACPLNLAPTASTTAALAVGDALAVALLKARGFTEDDFARSHPAGNLGRRLLLRVADVMRSGEAVPRVMGGTTTLAAALVEMSRKGLGMTSIVDTQQRLAGIFTDGDLRRAFDQGADVHSTPIEALMTRNPKTISAGMLAAEAAHIMETHRITALVVVDADNTVVGALNVHDLMRAGVV